MPAPYRLTDEPGASHEPARLEEPDDLGAIVSTHRALRPHALLFVVAIALNALALLTVTRHASFAGFVALGALLILLPLVTISVLARRLQASVELRERGLVVRRAWTDPVVVRFDDVDEVRFEAGFSGPSSWSTTLTTFSGRRVALVRGLAGAHELLAAIDRHVSRPLQAPAREALANGETLTFGPLVLERDAVVIREGAKRAADVRVAWSSLARVVVAPDRLELFAHDGERLASVALADVPHPRLAMTLLASRSKVEHATSVWDD